MVLQTCYPLFAYMDNSLELFFSKILESSLCLCFTPLIYFILSNKKAQPSWTFSVDCSEVRAPCLRPDLTVFRCMRYPFYDRMRFYDFFALCSIGLKRSPPKASRNLREHRAHIRYR